MFLSPNLIGKQKQFDDALMDEIEDTASHPFIPSEEDIIFPPNQQTNLVSGRALTCPASGPKRRTRSMKSTRDQRRPISRPYLEAWIGDHLSDQYPTKEAVNDLAAKEKLSFKQIKGWFGRRRKQMADASSPSNSTPGSDTTLPPNSYPSTDTRAQAFSDPGVYHDPCREYLPGLEERETLAEKLISCPSSSPIEQYRTTPPREECSPIQTSISVQNDKGPPLFKRRSTRSQNVGIVGREAGTFPEPVMSFSTTLSLHSSQDISTKGGEKPTLPHRQKGKRVAPQKQYALERQGKKIFQCTRCNIGYKFASDWARHLEIHEPQQHWTCMLQGETVIARGKVACPFCDASDPTQDHLSKHNVSRCVNKTHKKRTFQRRDHMLSHMKRIHNSLVENPPDAWMTVVHEDPNQQFWCGFCRDFLRMTWHSRLEHLSSHFKVGNLDMTEWVHEEIYLSSMPYLIGPTYPAGSIHPINGVHPLGSTPPMNTPFTVPAPSMPDPPASLAPPTNPDFAASFDYFMFDHPLDPYYPMGSDHFILPDQSPFSEAFDLDYSESVQD